MKLHCLFGLRKGYELPELMVAWDEYCVDSNPEGFEEDCEKAKESWGDDLVAHRMIEVKIDEEQLRAQFTTGEMKGEIATPYEIRSLSVEERQYLRRTSRLYAVHSDSLNWEEARPIREKLERLGLVKVIHVGGPGSSEPSQCQATKLGLEVLRS